MKRVGITQRVDCIEGYDELRDCLDQRWCDLLGNLDALCLPLPNVPPKLVGALFGVLLPDALIFSGGNSLTSVEPMASDASSRRDNFEASLLELALARSVPILAVCRGMQFINVALGGSLQRIEGHIAKRHSLIPATNARVPVEVNSYHGWTIPPDGLAPALAPLAFDEEGNIEAFEHKTQKIQGIMWHPERELEPSPEDIQLIKELLR